MNKTLFPVGLMICSLLISACAEKQSDMTVSQEKKNMNTSMHAAVKPKPGEEKSGLAEAVKKKKLLDYPSKTIGEAFDSYSYFNKREWSETFAANGKIYIDFIGWFNTNRLNAQNIKNGISAKGVEIKFALNPDGPFFAAMVSQVEVKTDGKTYKYPLPDIKNVLDSIYANKDISF